jgi:hypothetical protein
VGPFSPPSFSPPAVTPPVTAEFVSATQPANGAPQHAAYRLFRGANGNTRVDTGNLSVINQPAQGKTIVLDHIKKEAQISQAVPQMPQPAIPQMPGMPGVPGMPQMPSTQVQNLGKSVMQGLEVEGRRYTIQPPPMPKIPGMPQTPGMPGAPQIPGAPQTPGMPGVPQVPGMPQAAGIPKIPGVPNIPGMPKIPAAALPKPQLPSIAEVWTAPKLQLPMASKITGGFGQQTTMCRNVMPGEPNPGVFQIPAGYKVVVVKPKLPGVPGTPAVPQMPQAPGMPQVPKIPKF